MIAKVADRRAIAGVVVVALVASILVIAAQADGREVERATPNDGGAWLLDRGGARVGHIDHGSGEPTVSARIEDAGTGGGLSLMQNDGVVLIHDESANSIRRIRDDAAAIDIPVALEDGIEVSVRPGGAAVFDPELSVLQWPSEEELTGDAATFRSIFDGSAFFGEELAGQLVVFEGVETDDESYVGAAVVLEPGETEPARVVFPVFNGDPDVQELPDGFSPDAVTGANNAVVMVDGDQWVLATRDGVTNPEVVGGVQSLQRPSADPENVVAMLDDGSLLLRSLTGEGDVVIPRESPGFQGILPILDDRQHQPIFHDGCMHFLAEFESIVGLWGWCGGEDVEEFEFDSSVDGPIPRGAQMRLVNGEVWLDELNGFGRRPRNNQTLERTFELLDPEEAEEADEVEDGVEVEEFDPNDPDAELSDADQVDTDDENEQPEAADDEAGTRAGRDVFVDVLANDLDPDGDVLSVSEVQVSGQLAAELSVAITPDLGGIVVTQPTSSTPTGNAEIGYTISDGRGGSDTATVSFTVHGNDTNLAPEPTVDRLRVWAGAEVRTDVLANDIDPEGDTLTLTGLEDGAVGVSSWHPSGVVVLDVPTEQGTFELAYTLVDDRGGEAAGMVSVEVIDPGQNTIPDARHDRAQVSVGDRVALDALANDVDPGGLELVAVPQVTQIAGPPLGDGVEATLTEDGQFTFEPDAPGTYVFTYEVSNREQIDDALIRVEVAPEQANRAPVAVRDDVVLGIGETRLVRIFDNDGDPDGDVINLSFFSADSNVDFELIDGVGMLLSLTGAPSIPAEIEYRVSDGELESAPATIFVASSGSTVENAAPITVDDTVRARSGRSNRVFPLRNDFDPEGGRLVIDNAESLTPDIVAEIDPTGQWISVIVPTETELGGRRSFELNYIVRDEAGGAASGRLAGTLIFDDENNPPTARPDRAVTRIDTEVPIEVLGNDTDRESDPFDLIAVQPARNGVAEIDIETRQVVYTPGPGFTGADEFSYTIRDSLGAESTAFVSVGVIADITQPQNPIARDDNDTNAGGVTRFTFEAGSGTQLLDVLRNDEDPQLQAFTIVDLPGLEARLEGTGVSVELIQPVANNLILTTPEGSREPFDVEFEYTIENESGLTDTATVTVTILDNLESIAPCVENIPVPGEFSAGDTVHISLAGRYSDCGAGGDDATLELLAVGDPNVAGTGNELQLTIPADWTAASYSFDYSVRDSDEPGDDGEPLISTGTVTVQVVPNQAPTISPNPILVDFPHEPGREETIDLSQFVTDPEGDPLTFEARDSGNTAARIAGNSSSGQIAYTPIPGFSGDGFFSFVVSDGRNETTATVQFEVIIPNTPPEGRPVSVSFRAGESETFDLASAFSDVDLPDDTLTFVEEQLSPEGILSASRSGDVLTFTTESSVAASEFQVLVTATDQEGETATATITVTVEASNAPAPVVPSEQITLLSGESMSVDVLARSTSNLPDDASLTLLSAVVQDGQITAAVQDGAVQITASDPAWNGTAVVLFTVHDARGPDQELARADGTITVTVIGPPESPGQPEVSVSGPTSVLAQWSPPGSGGGSPIVGYRVLVNGPDGPRELESNGTQPSLEIAGLTAGQPYTVQVVAVNEEELESEPSAPSAEIRPDQAPGPPGRPTVAFVPGNFTQVQLNWDRSFNEGSPVEMHEIEVGECGRPGTSVGDELTTTIDLGGSAVRCTFRVRARNATVDAAGSPVWSPWSDFSEAECSVGVPAAPNAPSAMRGDQLAEVAWQEPASNDCQPLQRYEIQRFVNGSPDGPAKSVAQGTQNESSSPLVNGQTYTFQVRAESRQGFGEWSPSSPPVTPCGAPLPPTSVNAERGDMQAGLTFSGQSDNGCPITSFDVSVNGGPAQALVQGQPVGGLVNGTDYTFRVRGVNAEEGPGEWSNPSNSVRPLGPPIPIAFFAEDVGEIVWNSSFDGNGADTLIYNFSGNVGPDAGFGPLRACVTNAGGPCITDTFGGAFVQSCSQQAQTVTATVTATNEADTSPAISASVALPGCPSAPTLDGTAGDGEVFLSWTIPPGANSMHFFTTAQQTANGTSLTVRVPNGTTHTTTIWACNGLGCTPSNTVSLTPEQPFVPCAAPTNAAQSQDLALRAQLAWQAASATFDQAVDVEGFQRSIDLANQSLALNECNGVALGVRLEAFLILGPRSAAVADLQFMHDRGIRPSYTASRAAAIGATLN